MESGYSWGDEECPGNSEEDQKNQDSDTLLPGEGNRQLGQMVLMHIWTVCNSEIFSIMMV